MTKPDRLEFIGKKRPDGEPHEHLALYGIPAMDLSADDIDLLSNEQLKVIKAHPDLYREVEAKPAAAEPKAKE